jgi:hypothetical protein
VWAGSYKEKKWGDPVEEQLEVDDVPSAMSCESAAAMVMSAFFCRSKVISDRSSKMVLECCSLINATSVTVKAM